MDIIALTNKVIREIVDTANDIDSYLESDVPIECYRKDIDIKLMAMKERIAVMILETTGLPVQVVNSKVSNHLFSPTTNMCVKCGISAEDDCLENGPCVADGN